MVATPPYLLLVYFLMTARNSVEGKCYWPDVFLAVLSILKEGWAPGIPSDGSASNHCSCLARKVVEYIVTLEGATKDEA